MVGPVKKSNQTKIVLEGAWKRSPCNLLAKQFGTLGWWHHKYEYCKVGLFYRELHSYLQQLAYVHNLLLTYYKSIVTKVLVNIANRARNGPNRPWFCSEKLFNLTIFFQPGSFHLKFDSKPPLVTFPILKKSILISGKMLSWKRLESDQPITHSHRWA